MVMALMLQSQDDLGVVVKNFVDVRGRQHRLAQIEEVLPIRLERQQDRIVAPGHEVVGAERLPGAKQRGLRAVAEYVVEERGSGLARGLRQIRMVSLRLVVEALEQYGDDAAQMRDDLLDVREAL